MYVMLKNEKLGKAIFIDSDKKRLWRMRERVNAWIDCLPENTDMYMITLTYDTKGTLSGGEGHNWTANDIREFNIKLKGCLGDGLIGYAWVMELMRNKVPHYHYIAIVKKGILIPYLDTMGLWNKGLTRVEKARTPFYLLKYTGKEYQKDFENYPKGARLFAIWLKGKRDEIRYKLLNYEEKEIVDRAGWDCLKALQDMDNYDSGWVLMGTAVTFEYAVFMVEDYNNNFKMEVIEEIYDLLSV